MPAFKVAFRFLRGDTPSPLWNYPLEGRKRRGGRESGTETCWARGASQGALNNSGRVPSFEGVAPSPLRNDLSGGAKETR